MTDFVYGVSHTERRRGDFPALPVVNMLAEEVPTEPGVALQSRPGLAASSVEWGIDPVRGIYKADGVLSNGLFGVAGRNLYREESIIGTINGDGPVSFAGYQDYVFANAGADIVAWSGTAFSTISFPDNADVIKIMVGASRLIAIRKDTGVFYWSDPLDIIIDPLSFATAENSPDTLKDGLYLGDKLILFGAETVEFWPATTDADAPFAPLPGATLPVGIKDTGLAVLFNRTFAWITNFNEVCMGDAKNIISEPELQVRIRESEELKLWTFYVDDNEYLAVRLDNETWVFGARSQVWSKFTTGTGNWIPQCYDADYFGSSTDGKLLQWSDSNLTDLGILTARSFRAWAPLTSGAVNISNIMLRTNPGTTPYITGNYTDPIVELRTSRDGGHSWQPWKQRSLGAIGNYRIKLVWSSMGQFSYPGILVEVRITDPVPFRMSGFVYNEPFGGR